MIIKNRYLILILTLVFRYVQFYNLTSNNSLLCYIFVIAIFGLSLLEILSLKFNKRDFIKIILVLCLTLICFLLNTDSNLFLYALVAIAFINHKNDDLIKCFFITSITMYVTTIILNQFGIISSNNATRTAEIDSKIRYSLGFGHVNSVFLYFLPILYSGYYLFSKNKTYILISFISSLILFIFSNCRTGFIFSILFIVVISSDKIKKFLKINIKYFFIMITFLTFILSLKFSNGILNDFLSGRLSYAHNYIVSGNLFNMFSSKYLLDDPLDIFYINVFITEGIPMFLFYLYLYSFVIKKIKDEKLLIIACFFMFYGLSEASTIGNFILIILLKELFSINKVSLDD